MTSKVVVVAHCPAFGVKVYVPVAKLLTVAGDQTPVIGVVFVEFVGKTGAVSPAQIAEIAANVGVIAWFTMTSSVAVVAHCPAVGVNVYVPVAKLLTVAGDQTPEIGGVFVEFVGKTGAVSPEQIAAIIANVGVIG